MIANAQSVYIGDELTPGASPDDGWMTERYRTVGLTEIPLDKLVAVKVTLTRFGTQDHRRWVFRSTEACAEMYFYKIWNPTYVRRDNILTAIASGFIDDDTVPALDGLIFHDGVCRGYVMRACERESGLLDEAFRELIYARTRSTQQFLVQLSDHHVMRHRRRRSLLDLEGVYPMAALPHLPDLNSHFEDPLYARFVLDLYRGIYPESDRIDMHRVYRGRPAVARRRAKRILLRTTRAIRNCFPRSDLIQSR